MTTGRLFAAFLVAGCFIADCSSATERVSFEASNFDHSMAIDNKYMPMRPGTRWIYEGVTVEDDGKTVPHRLEVTVTALTKVIGGVAAVVAYDQDRTDGEIVEAEIAFFAQDRSGNVWLVGEYPEEYEDGAFTKAPTWIHGALGARAGIMMQANPRPGTPSYAEGWGPAVGWTDRGVVHQIGQRLSVPAGAYGDVLVIKETASAEPDAEQLKYYAPGVGNVRVGWTGDEKKVRETMDLVRVETLDPRALAEVQAAALKLDERAYVTSKDAYGHTRRIQTGGPEP